MITAVTVELAFVTVMVGGLFDFPLTALAGRAASSAAAPMVDDEGVNEGVKDMA